MFRTVPLLRTCAPSRCISQLSRSGKIIANMKLNTFIPMATTSHIIINIIDDTNTLSTKSAIQQTVLEFCNDHDNVKFISSRYHEDKTYARIVHSPNSLDLSKLKKYEIEIHRGKIKILEFQPVIIPAIDYNYRSRFLLCLAILTVQTINR